MKLLGRYVPVRAEVLTISAFSVHADQAELLGWLRSAPREPAMVYVVHGEPESAGGLESAIERELGWPAAVARDLECVRLD